MARKKFAVMLNRRGLAVLPPVRADRSHAMRANGNDLFNLILFQRFQIVFRKLAESQIVTQPASWIACTFFFPQDSEAGVQVAHHLGERCDDFAALWIVSAHAAQPQAIFLAAVENRKLLFLNELVALGGGKS